MVQNFKIILSSYVPIKYLFAVNNPQQQQQQQQAAPQQADREEREVRPLLTQWTK